MKLIYKGKFNGDPTSVPCKEHRPNAIPFKEIQDIKKFGYIMNIASIIILIVFYYIYYCRTNSIQLNTPGGIIALLTLFPHELLHAICFKKEVYLYTYFSSGTLFVAGPEDMSKARFIFMSLLPNIIFGFIPFIIFLFFPNCTFLGTIGLLCITMGVGDYYNVFNAITQMPKGARTYLYQTNSYWYIPENIKG